MIMKHLKTASVTFIGCLLTTNAFGHECEESASYGQFIIGTYKEGDMAIGGDKMGDNVAITTNEEWKIMGEYLQSLCRSVTLHNEILTKREWPENVHEKISDFWSEQWDECASHFKIVQEELLGKLCN